MKILVTGGAGYIGTDACKELAATGFEPVTYDNLSRGNRWAVKWGPLEVGDIADEQRLRQVLDRHQPVAVIHFAAFAYVGESVEDPKLYYQNNVCGSAALLRTITQSKSIPLVFSSTCATYGVPMEIPISEIISSDRSIRTGSRSLSLNECCRMSIVRMAYARSPCDILTPRVPIPNAKLAKHTIPKRI